MGWCNDIKYPKKYNKLIKIEKKVSHEKMFRFDRKYDFVIPIKYNYKNPVINKGSAIFFHLTNSYKPTAGCIALNLNDFLIFLKLLDKENKIKIYQFSLQKFLNLFLYMWPHFSQLEYNRLTFPCSILLNLTAFLILTYLENGFLGQLTQEEYT